jgi:cobalt/nickel transport protein
MNKFKRKLLVGLVVLALLSPMGILLPHLFKSGEPWGESSAEKVSKELGYVPKGMQKVAKLWKAPVKDYSMVNADKPVWEKSVAYFASGLFGIGLIAVATLFLYKYYKNYE